MCVELRTWFHPRKCYICMDIYFAFLLFICTIFQFHSITGNLWAKWYFRTRHNEHFILHIGNGFASIQIEKISDSESWIGVSHATNKHMNYSYTFAIFCSTCSRRLDARYIENGCVFFASGCIECSSQVQLIGSPITICHFFPILLSMRRRKRTASYGISCFILFLSRIRLSSSLLFCCCCTKVGRLLFDPSHISSIPVRWHLFF